METDGTALTGILARAMHTASSDAAYRDWLRECIARIDADFNRSADTHLLKLELPGLPGIELYLKDEASHPTGSLKHRLARSLFLYGLCNGRIRPGGTVVEASSGSTAVSEAYFARLIGVDFIAVVPEGTSPTKLAEIRRLGGRCMEVPPAELYAEAERIAAQTGGCYLDQFTNAERATDWRGNNNIAESLFEQMAMEPHPAPDWIVVGAGTGGTSATIGRYIRYRPALYGHTRLCVADPENSVFFEAYRMRDRGVCTPARSRIEGVGRPRVEPSFLEDVIDCVVSVSDAASIATTLWLERRLQKRCGPSTGLNVYVLVQLALEMRAAGREGSLVTLICDGGERYGCTIYDEDWRAQQGLDCAPVLAELERLFPE